jgi:endoglycosylceramidase
MDKITTQNMRFVDQHGRERIFNGVNICDKGRFNGKNYEYVTKWDDDRLDRLAENGVNLIRLGTTWDAIEPEPGKYNDEYIDALVGLADRCAEHKMYFYLDMHQDLYSGFDGLAGDGAPKWACLTKGAVPQPTKFVWAEGYFWGRAVQNAFDAFWNNEKVEGKGLLEYFADMWAHLASRFKDHPALFGFDMLNEPYPGTDGGKIFRRLILNLIWVTLTDKRINKIELIKTALSKNPIRVLDFYTGDVLRSITKSCDNIVKDFDLNRYSPFLNRTSEAIRNVTDEGILFVDNNYYSNTGIPSFTPPITVNGKVDEKQCFGPHAYDFMVDTELYKFASNSRVGSIFEEHRRAQERLGIPVVVGEWGGNSEGTEWLPHIEYLLALFDSYKWSFTYWEHTAYLYNAPLKKTLQRPFPTAVCGEIVSYKHNRANKCFTLIWEQDKEYDVPTEVFVPFEAKRILTDGDYSLDGTVLKINGKVGHNELLINF